MARLLFYVKFTYTPTSDPLVFFETGQKIAQNQSLVGDTYIASFPYLASYETILGYVMKVIHDPWLATVSLNIIFDIAGAFIAYLLVKSLTKPNSKLPIAALAIWLLNPLNIVFSVLSLPVIIVNFFIITSVYITHLLIKAFSSKKIVSILPLSLLLGLVLSIGNSFRPIFPVVIIAFMLFLLYVVISNKKTVRLLVTIGASFLVVLSLFVTLDKLYLTYVSSQTHLPTSQSSGWSIYVGSNIKHNGMWNLADEEAKTKLCGTSTVTQLCHQKLQDAAINRYEALGIKGTVSLFIKKMYVFSSEQANIYNAHASLKGYSGSTIEKIVTIYTNLFLTAIFYLSAVFLYLSAKRLTRKRLASSSIVFLALLMIGFFLSSALVETSPRYALIMYPLLTIFATLSLQLILKKTN